MKIIYAIIFLSITFFTTYHDVIYWMYNRYISPDSYYSHAFFIPFISGFLIYKKKDELIEIQPECSLLGLLIIILSFVLHVLGTILYVFSISGFSIFILLIGISLYIFGEKIFNIIFFPIVFMLFMFPLPLAFISKLSFPLKMIVAKGGVWIAKLWGFPILREGFYITIPAGNLLVGNPCSGLRSIISFLALGSIFAYIIDTSTSKKWLIFIISVPIALLSNIVRIFILILISQYWSIEAASPESVLHNASGIFVFILGLSLLFFFGKIVEKI